MIHYRCMMHSIEPYWCMMHRYIDAWCTALSYILMPDSIESWMHSIESQLRMQDATILNHIDAFFTGILMPDAQHWATYWCLIALNYGCTALSHNHVRIKKVYIYIYIISLISFFLIFNFFRNTRKIFIFSQISKVNL